MKSLTYVIAALYVLFMISCTNNKNTKKNHSETINQSSTVDSHKGHEHQHENEADEHNHEGHEHQHKNEADEHNHEGHEHQHKNEADEHNHEGHEHQHENEADEHNHEGHEHQHKNETDEHDHEGHEHQHENEADEHNHEGHEHQHENEADEHNHEGHEHQHKNEADEHNHEGHEHQHKNEADEHNHEGHEHQADNHDGHNHDTVESHATLNDADHTIITLKAKPFSTIFKTSGELLPAKGDELIVSALHSGIVRLQGNQLFDGKPINKGETILNVSGKEMAENNLQVHFLSAKAAFENAQKNFNRVKQLKNDTIVSEKEFFAAKLTFTKAKSEFQAIKRNYHKGTQKVLAPTQGFIKKLYVTDGQFVEAGAPLFTISRNARLVLKAELSQEYISRISEIKCAQFKPAYTQQIFDTHDLNGQVISYGKTTAENSYYTPLFIEIDKVQQLIPGSYVEVFLRIHNEKEAIVIPRKALLEEQGQYYVFVKHNNEFEKRYVKLGESDGSNVEVLNGLRQNEQIATNEVYRIKLSQTGSAIPHGHSH